MKRRKSLVVGIVCGVACVACVLLYVHDAQAAMDEQRAEVLARYGGEQVEVYVASRDIAAGSQADAANAEKVLFPSELLPEGAVTDLSEVSGLPAQDAVYAGEVLTARRFERETATAIQVPDGLCAISVPAKATSALGGSVQPGDVVSVYATSASATDLIASGVTVLATSASAQDSARETSSISWITLAVEPELVTELIAAAGTCDLYFSLPSEGLSASDVEAAAKAASSSSASKASASASAGSDASADDEGAEEDQADLSESQATGTSDETSSENDTRASAAASARRAE